MIFWAMIFYRNAVKNPKPLNSKILSKNFMTVLIPWAFERLAGQNYSSCAVVD
jgi:hypothetical protein